MFSVQFFSYAITSVRQIKYRLLQVIAAKSFYEHRSAHPYCCSFSAFLPLTVTSLCISGFLSLSSMRMVKAVTYCRKKENNALSLHCLLYYDNSLDFCRSTSVWFLRKRGKISSPIITFPFAYTHSLIPFMFSFFCAAWKLCYSSRKLL